MSILHLIRRSAFETQDLAQCLLTLSADDKLILLDDGCYNLHHSLMNKVKEICRFDIVEAHARARAVYLKDAESDTEVGIISISELTEMITNFDAISTWQ